MAFLGYARAVEFFYANAPYSWCPAKETEEQGRRSGARALARAEVIAFYRDWNVEWCEGVDEADFQDEDGQWRTAPASVAILRSADESVLSSIGGILENDDAEYRRIIEAQLALEALRGPGAFRAAMEQAA